MAFVAKVSFKFCDLAGSERQYKTNNNTGNGLKEAQSINSSLTVLGRCLKAATVNNERNKNKKQTTNIPFRESKLTLLLQAALQGKEKLIMIANVTPTDTYFEENMNVLNFASITRNILYNKYSNPSLNIRCSGIIDCTHQQYVQERHSSLEQKLLLENAVYVPPNHLTYICICYIYVYLYMGKHIHIRYRLCEELEQTILNYEQEIKQMKEAQLQELHQQEHRLRNELSDRFQSMYSDYKSRKQLFLEREIARQKTFYKSEVKRWQSSIIYQSSFIQITFFFYFIIVTG